MTKQDYAEKVLERIHEKTLKGQLKWKPVGSFGLRTEPTSTITVDIEYMDDGPNSSTWETVKVQYPVGIGVAKLANPESDSCSSRDIKASGKTLERIHEIFRHVLLSPREKQFQDAMTELEKS